MKRSAENFLSSESSDESSSEIIETESSSSSLSSSSSSSVLNSSSSSKKIRVVHSGGKGERKLIDKFGDILVQRNGRVVFDQKVRCICGNDVSARTDKIRNHLRTAVHLEKMNQRSAGDRLKGMLAGAAHLRDRDRTAELARFALLFNVPIETIHQLVTHAPFLSAIQGATPGNFRSPNVLRDQGILEFKNAQQLFRERIRSDGDFSICIDETRRSDGRPMCGLLVRQFHRVYLMDSFDMSASSTTAEAFLGILDQFLRGADGQEPLDRSKCIQIMGDNCNTMISVKHAARERLELPRLLFKGDCVSHLLNTVEESIFKEQLDVKRLVHGIHKSLFGAGELSGRRSALLDFTLQLPPKTPGARPPDPQQLTLQKMNQLRCKTTRWHARVTSIAVICQYRNLLKAFFTKVRNEELGKDKEPSKCLTRAVEMLSDDLVIFKAICIFLNLDILGRLMVVSQGRKHRFGALERAQLTELYDKVRVIAEKNKPRHVEVPRAMMAMLTASTTSHSERLDEYRTAYFEMCKLLKSRLENKRLQDAVALSVTIEFFIPLSAVRSLSEHDLAELEGLHSSEEILTKIGGNALVELADPIVNPEDFEFRAAAEESLYRELRGYIASLLVFKNDESRLSIPDEKFWCCREENDVNAIAREPLGGDRFPHLARLAKSVLSLSISNGPLESAFSAWRRIDTSVRQNTRDELSKAYFFFHFNKELFI